MSLETLVTELDGFFVEVDAFDLKVAFAQFVKQTSRTAGRFKQLPGFSFKKFLIDFVKEI